MLELEVYQLDKVIHAFIILLVSHTADKTNGLFHDLAFVMQEVIGER